MSNEKHYSVPLLDWREEVIDTWKGYARNLTDAWDYANRYGCETHDDFICVDQLGTVES